MTNLDVILRKLEELNEAKDSQNSRMERVERVLTLLLKKLNRLSRTEVKVSVDESKGHYQRIVEFLRSKNNEPQTAGAILRATKVPRGSLSQILYRTHKHSFVSFNVPGYTRRRLWALTEEAARVTPSRPAPATEVGRAGRGDLFDDFVEGDLAGLDASECCRRILADHGNVPMAILALTREAIRRGYRARTRGSEDEILFSTAKSFWARLGRDERFIRVRPFVYRLRNP